MQSTTWVTAGQLYLVATPIGNLADMSARALAILQQVDVIAAEDTRHTAQLLAHFAIRKPLMSVHEHNECRQADAIIARLQAGEAVAYVSDAGTPAISDPGARLVQAVTAAGLVVVSVPGASSVLTAIAGSGLDVRAGFCFLGFVPTQSKEKQLWEERLAQTSVVSVFFEAPHRIMSTLSWLAQVFPERPMVLAKELTKLHERYIRGCTVEVLAQLQAEPQWQRGEFVLLLGVQPKPPQTEVQCTLSLTMLLKTLLAQMPLSQAVKLACQLMGLKKNDVYAVALALQSASSTDGCC